jgi:hypothetical protein
MTHQTLGDGVYLADKGQRTISCSVEALSLVGEIAPLLQSTRSSSLVCVRITTQTPKSHERSGSPDPSPALTSTTTLTFDPTASALFLRAQDGGLTPIGSTNAGCNVMAECNLGDAFYVEYLRLLEAQILLMLLPTHLQRECGQGGGQASMCAPLSATHSMHRQWEMQLDSLD